MTELSARAAARGHPLVRLGLFYTYIHKRSDTGQVFYVGKGRRSRAYLAGDRNPHWKNIAAKCSYTVEIVAPWETEGEAFAHEVLLIQVFRSLGHPLVNKTDGGEGPSGAKASAETRAKMSAANRRLRQNAEYVERLREAVSRGKRTPEARAAASVAMSAHRGTEAARKKQSADTAAAWRDPDRAAARKAAMRSRLSEPEMKKKWSEASKRKLESAETREKVVANLLAANARNSTPVLCIETGQIFPSIARAAEGLGTTRSRVRDACRRESGRMGDITLRFTVEQPTQLPPDSGPPSER